MEWLAREELSLASDEEDAEQPKPSFEKLRARYGMAQERLDELYGLFTHFVKVMWDPEQEVPEDETTGEKKYDQYPDQPASLTRDQLRTLFTKYFPNVTAAEFDYQLELVDFSGNGSVEFDEFLDFPFDDPNMAIDDALTEAAAQKGAEAGGK